MDIRHRLLDEPQASCSESARSYPWPYKDRWNGASVTEVSARIQARYAARLYDAAMREVQFDAADPHQADSAAD